MTSTAWRNWGRNQRANPAVVARPRDADEVAHVVKQATSSGRRVKAVGSGHSFTAAAVTDGVLVDLADMPNEVCTDPATGLVRVAAGTPLHVLNRELARNGLAMTNLGDIDRQTVAGATSTGTHGTGRLLGGLATQIRGLELVLADGSVLSCSPTEDAEVFDVARVGLGALGIVTAVTLQCEPAFVLRADERPMPLAAVEEGLDELVADNEHFEFYWFPHTDVALTKRNNRLPPDEPPRPLGRVRGWVDDELLSNTVYGWTCAFAHRRPTSVPRLNRIAARALSARTYTAPSDGVFVSPRRVRFVEMEYAVPRAAVLDALHAIRDVIARDELLVSFPVEVRFSAADDIPLSTASGRESAYLAIHRYYRDPFEPYFRAVEARLRELGGRPHWGKMHWRTADDLRPVYPRFDDFVAVRERLDPDRVFGNDYLTRVLGS